jgi:PAS domain S-box-containing protein
LKTFTKGRSGACDKNPRDRQDFFRLAAIVESSDDAIFDSLTAHIAVLDENGTIIAVNKAWRDFAAANPPVTGNVCQGADYLAVCDAAEGEDRLQALAFSEGIRAVMKGRQKVFSLEYPCHSPKEKRWFAGRVTRFAGPGPVRIVVSHENITERKLAEEGLRHYRAHLEELVEARTAELAEKNVQLAREVAERRRAEIAIRDSEIKRSDKQFLYTLGVAHDITARKVAEKALRESHKRMALLKEVASAANAAVTVDDVLKVAVEGIARYIGWPVGHVYIMDDEQPGVLKPSDIWYLEDGQRFRSFMELTARTVFAPGEGMVGRILQSRKPMCVEDLSENPLFLRKKFDDDTRVRGAFGFPIMVDGKVKAVLEFFSPRPGKPEPGLMDLMEEIGGQLGIVLQRKKTEETLKKLSRAIEQSPATVVITDVRGRIQYVNPVFSTLTGYSAEEASGKTPRILKSGFHSKSFYKELWDTILSGRQWYGKFCNRKKKGEIYWEQASISPVRNERGEITHFVAVKEDITKLLEYEAELKQAKESAESANRAKSDFLASMSHELRTPLNAIIGFSEVLKEKYFGPLTEKQEEYVTDILSSGKHLLELINDILDLSKIEAGKMTLELSSVRIADLVRQSLTMVREKAAKHGIALDLEIDSALEEIQIPADERKLKQVLFNLLSNAVKFTPDGGAIRVAVRHRAGGDVVSSAAPGADLLEISVSDTGIGVEPADQEKIFEPFYQVGQGQTNKPPGTGLGLSVSRELVELHGGILRVQSRGKNQGSTFLLTIPIEGTEITKKTIGEA